MLNIYINTWGNYNENGADGGEWISLPMDEDELQAKLDEVAEAMNDDDPEWFVNDYEWTTDFEPFDVEEMENYFKLNECLQELDNLNGYEQTALCAIIEATGDDIEQALKTLQREWYTFYPDMDLEEVAEEIINDCYNLPEFALRYFDYSAFARDLGFDGYTETNYGVIYID
jgi:hypothetical protein